MQDKGTAQNKYQFRQYRMINIRATNPGRDKGDEEAEEERESGQLIMKAAEWPARSGASPDAPWSGG